MNRSSLIRFAISAVAFAACTPTVHDTNYQSYVVQLNGPVPVESSPATDPFVQSVNFQATLKYFEDSAGTVPYGSSVKNEPSLFKDFSPTQTVVFPANGQNLSLAPSGGDAALPRLSSGQTSLFVSSEIVGLDAMNNPVARARCPVQELQVLSATLPTTVTCQAFFGLIGRWNEIRSPAISRFNFGAAVLPNGSVIIGGGKVAALTPTDQSDVNTVELYEPNVPDPAAPMSPPGIWVSEPALSKARSDLTATYTTAGHVFFVGGEINANTASEEIATQIDEWDSATGLMLTNVAQLTTPRGELAAAAIGDDTVLAAGGILALPTSSMPQNTNSDVIQTNKTVLPGQTLANSHNYPCMFSMAPGQAIVCGGSSTGMLSDSCELVSSTGSGTATQSGTLDLPRADVKCAVIGSSAFIIGGALSGGSPGTSIEQWSNDNIMSVGMSPSGVGVNAHAVAAAGSTLIVDTGGYATNSTTPLATGFTFDTSTQTVTPLTGASAMNNPRAHHQLVGLPDGTVMAIGGLTGAQPVAVGAEIYVP